MPWSRANAVSSPNVGSGRCGAHRISVRFPIACDTAERRDHPRLGQQPNGPLRREVDDLGVAAATAAASLLRPAAGWRRIESLFGVVMCRS